MDKQILDDARLAEMLRQRYTLEVERSAARAAKLLADVVARPTGRPPTLRTRQLGAMTFAAVAIAVAAVLLRTGPPLNQGAGNTALGSPAATVLGTTVGPTVAPTVTTADGIPTTIDGQPVLFGSAAASAIANSTDDTPILVGGWFHAGQGIPDSRICDLMFWGNCSGFELYTGKAGPDGIWIRIAQGYPPAVDPAEGSASTRAVVLRIHTHDAGCAQSSVWPRSVKACQTVPIADEIVWTGPTN